MLFRSDVLGLSGLITPSLDEMVFVAREMERRGLSIPLLIGGATTSRQHTAVKIAPEYRGATVHVLDASRVGDVMGSLLAPAQREAFESANRETQEQLRQQHQARRERPLVAYSAALKNRLQTNWAADAPLPTPVFLGRREVTVALADLVPFIDWTFFFAAWEIGRAHV